MNKPIDLDESDSDEEEGEDVDVRPVKMKLSGFVVPVIKTQLGKIMLSY